MSLEIDNLLVKMIKKIPLFSNISDEDAKKFASKFKLNYYFPNQVIIREGEYPSNIYIVKNWKLEVKKANALWSVVLWYLWPGDIFGEMSYFSWDPAMASVVSVTDVDLWEIPREVFAKFLEKYDYIYKHAWEVYHNRKKENEKKSQWYQSSDDLEEISITI